MEKGANYKKYIKQIKNTKREKLKNAQHRRNLALTTLSQQKEHLHISPQRPHKNGLLQRFLTLKPIPLQNKPNHTKLTHFAPIDFQRAGLFKTYICMLRALKID